VKDFAQDVAEDFAQGVAGGVLGAWAPRRTGVWPNPSAAEPTHICIYRRVKRHRAKRIYVDGKHGARVEQPVGTSLVLSFSCPQ